MTRSLTRALIAPATLSGAEAFVAVAAIETDPAELGSHESLGEAKSLSCCRTIRRHDEQG